MEAVTCDFEVKQEHIDKGERRHSCRCAVALALNEAFGGAWQICLGNAVFERQRGWSTPVPEEIAKFARAFDDRKPIAPRRFTIFVHPEIAARVKGPS